MELEEVAVRQTGEKICVGSCVDSALVIFEFLMAVSMNVALGLECDALPMYQTSMLPPSSGRCFSMKLKCKLQKPL